MGIVYRVEKTKKVIPTGINNELNVLLCDLIDEKYINQFLELQKQAKGEITEPIELISREGALKISDKNREPNLKFALVLVNEDIIGYGYGYQEGDTFKIDTIFIVREYRGKGISKRIFKELFLYADTIDDIVFVKGVTQPGNFSAFNLMKSFNMLGVKMIRVEIKQPKGFVEPQIEYTPNDSGDPISKAILKLLQDENYLNELVEHGRAKVVHETNELKVIDYYFN